jgi:hypothetical protein
MKVETIQLHIFQFVSILFFIYFLYSVYSHSVVDALRDTLTAWATVVISTPIPSVSILLGFPLKLFFKIPIYITYLFIAVLSFFILVYFKSHDSSFVQHILETKTYSIFIISIVSSTILTHLLDSGIEYVVDRKPMHHTLSLVLASSALIILYSYQVHQMKTE